MDNHKQTDLILLDFQKAFDTVPSATSMQAIIAWYPKSIIFLDRFLAHPEEAVSDC